MISHIVDNANRRNANDDKKSTSSGQSLIDTGCFRFVFDELVTDAGSRSIDATVFPVNMTDLTDLELKIE